MIQTKSDLIQLIKTLEPQKIVFWIGAGVDCNSPTNLPLANNLLEKILVLTCGEEYAKSIKDQYELVYQGIPRMETVISEIKLFESELAIDSTIVNGLSSFLDAPPNSCHQVLAQFLNKGSNIVSLNYGNTIAKAFNMQYDNTFPTKPVFDEEFRLYMYKSENITQGKIYHLHGVADDLRTIGISLNEVKKTFSPKFKEQLTEWINNSYCFIFLGYSCSDTLDVNPFFLNLKTKGNATGIIINYSKHESFANENQDSNMDNILTPFNQKIIFNTITRDFIESLAIHDYEKIKNNDDNNDDGHKWSDNFENCIIPYNQDLYQYIALGLINSLGLDCKEILASDWYKQQKKYELFKRHWYIDYNSFICLSRDSNFSNAINFSTKLDNSQLTKSDIYANIGLTKKAARAALPVTEIYNILHNTNWANSNYQIDWTISTALNRNAQWIIIDILRNPFLFKIKQKRYSKLADTIIKCNNIIINLGNDYVLNFIQQLTALRYNGVLLMVFKNKYAPAIRNLKKALDDYTAISSIAGIIRCKLYLAFVELSNFRINKDSNSLNAAQSYLSDIHAHYSKIMKSRDKYIYILLKIYLAFC
ncbi:MAG: SIR2 family protein [Clostridium sp.]|nr:SIR2 family protein [Clostridium sp.]